MESLEKNFLQGFKSRNKDKNDSSAKFSEGNYKHWLNIFLYEKY